MTKKIVVYQHRRNDTNEIFYVGIGKTKDRAYSVFHRNKYWKHIVESVGYNVEIVEWFSDYDKAKLKEIELISKYGRKDLGNGNLVNMTDGGEGSLNRKFTKESLKKISESSKGRIPTQETRIKMSESRTGFIKSREQIENARYSQPHMKSVEQYDMNGNLLNRFRSINEASRETNSTYSAISMCCSGKRNKHNNYIWKYGTDIV